MPSRRQILGIGVLAASYGVFRLGAAAGSVDPQQVAILREISAKLSTISGQLATAIQHLATLSSTVDPDLAPSAVTVNEVT